MNGADGAARERRREVRKTAYLLAAVLLHNLIYPLSAGDGAQPLLFYLVFSTIFVAAVFALGGGRVARWAIAIFGAAVLASGVANSYTPSSATALALYLAVIAYHGVMIGVLARYTFAADKVMTEVILAATSLYLILGSAFTALYGLVEWIAPGSFVASSGAAVEWQQLLYYSYVTLTTLGYGDITPVGFYAQALAAFEAVVGVLYTVVLLSRLVGLHASGRS